MGSFLQLCQIEVDSMIHVLRLAWTPHDNLVTFLQPLSPIGGTSRLINTRLSHPVPTFFRPVEWRYLTHRPCTRVSSGGVLHHLLSHAMQSCWESKYTVYGLLYWADRNNLVKGCRETLDCYCVSCELLSASVADALWFVNMVLFTANCWAKRPWNMPDTRMFTNSKASAMKADNNSQLTQ